MPCRASVCLPGRRQFLRLTALSAALAALPACRSGRWRTLTEREGATLSALCDRIIPPDEFPGAAAAGAVDFLDRQLGGAYRKHRLLYRNGCAALELTAQARFAQRFGALTAERQDELLAALERREVPPGIWNAVDPAQFFSLAITHTMQSYYGNPRHGGNRDFVSWRMLKAPPAPVRGREQHDWKSFQELS
jgi:gluconate 2-dehydrogenase gamma chain